MLYLRLPSTTTATLLHGDLTINNIRTIDQKYLEPEHTEMLWRLPKNAFQRLYQVSGILLSKWREKGKPYTVVPLKYTDIVDFKDDSSKILPLSLMEKSVVKG